MTEDATVIQTLKYVTYYPAKDDKKAGFSLKGRTDGENVKAWAGPNALKAIKDRLERGEKNEWGGTEYKVQGTFGVSVTYGKVELLNGNPQPAAGHAGVTLADLELKAEWAAKTAYRTGDAFKDNPEALQAWASTLFIQAARSNVTVGGSAAPQEDYAEMPAALTDEDDGDLPF